MTDLIREIDEDLRRDNFEKLLRKYGSYLLGAALLSLLVLAAGLLWWDHLKGQREDRARRYDAALQLIGTADPTAPEALQALAQGDDGYAALARLRAAALKADAGDVEGAVAIYEELAGDLEIDKAIRDVALLLLALHTADSAEPAQLTRRLQPLTEASSPWRYSALEITAVLARRAGDTEKAQQILTGLADDLDAPRDLRTRATEMLAAWKG